MLRRYEIQRWEQQDKCDPISSLQDFLFGDEPKAFDQKLEKFPPNIRSPSDVNTDADNKLMYTVWTRVHRKETDYDVGGREFDSSFATLKEANIRVEYVFHYEATGGGNGHGDVDRKLTEGLRYMRSEPDGGGSLTVSVFPSEVFDILKADNDPPNNPNLDGFHSRKKQPKQHTRNDTTYPKHIRNPGAANKKESKKLQFTVWTSWVPPSIDEKFEYDDWRSQYRFPGKDFNSSYDTIEEANERAEYVFFYEFPWKEDYFPMDDQEEVEFPHVKIDFVSSKTGLRHLHSRDGYLEHQWTVSVVTSSAFDYMDI